MSHWVAVLLVGDGVGLRVRFNLALVFLGCVVLGGLPAVVHGQGAQIPQYPTSVDPYEVIVFEHEDYTGYYQSFKLDPTKRQLLVPFLDGSLDNKINSFRVGEKVGVTFFSHPKFQYFWMTSPQHPIAPHNNEKSSTKQPIHTPPWQYSKDASSLIVYHRAVGLIGVVMANDPVSELDDVNHRFYPLFEDWTEAKVCWKSLSDLDGETEYALIFPTRGTAESQVVGSTAHLYDGYGKVYVTLYDRPDCQGDWITLPGQGSYSTEFKLDKYEWDEKARSLEVRWEGPVPTVQVPMAIIGTATVHPSEEHVRAPAAPTHVRAPSAGDFEDGVDRPGSNLRAFEVAGGPDECSQACAADPQCRAFTWVRPGVQGPQARCWLKSEVPAAVPNANCVSGLKAGQISAGTSNIAPIAPAGPSAPQQGPAPVDQAAGAGLPMLAEITLAPGDPPATYIYTASTSGPHRLIAAWGSPVGIRLEVYGDGPDPWVAEGNPATVRVEAVGGMEFRVRVSPVGSLPVTSVLQLHGGPVN